MTKTKQTLKLSKPMRLLFSTLIIVLVSTALLAQTTAGIASYYAPGLDGEKTSSGERYRHAGFTAANKDYPFGSVIRVIRADDGRFVDVRVNDCGPHKPGRVVDLSGAAAEQIGLIRDGITQVRVELISLGKGRMPCGGKYVAPEDRPASYDAVPGGGDEMVARAPAEPAPIEAQGTFRAEALRPIAEGFGVQVGSFRVYENATKVAADLEAKGYSKVLIRLRGNVHQVVLGPFETREAAAVYRDNLLRKYKLRGFVTPITQGG